MPHIVIDARPLRAAGYGTYLTNLIMALGHLDQTSHYTVLVWPGSDTAGLGLPANFHFKVVDYPINGSLKEQLNLARDLRQLRPDLVHFGFTQQPVLYLGPKITTIHDLTTVRFHNPSQNWLLYRFKRSVYKWVIKRVARTSKLIITPSNYVKEDLALFAGLQPAKIKVTYEAADKIQESPKPISGLKKGQFIMYVGRPQPHKNLYRLIEAFEALQPKYPQLQLIFAGKKDVLYERLEKLVSKKQIKNVRFMGHVREAHLRWLYENTAAYVFPSLSEGFGLPGLEAMAHGAPVVASQASCLPEIYGQAAHYFDPLDVADMADKISEVLSSEPLAKQLVAAGTERVKRYSWAKMAARTLEIYRVGLDS